MLSFAQENIKRVVKKKPKKPPTQNENKPIAVCGNDYRQQLHRCKKMFFTSSCAAALAASKPGGREGCS